MLVPSFRYPSGILTLSPRPSAEERGGSVPPAVARDERDPGPEAAGAGGSPDPRPHEGRQAAHHSQIGLGQRVSTSASGADPLHKGGGILKNHT